MTKQQVIKIIAQQHDLEPNDIKKVLDTFFNVIKEGLEKREAFYFRNFGQFTVKHRKEKIGRNFNNNASMVIAACDVPFFKPSKKFFNR